VFQGLWMGLIGLFLNGAAQSSDRQVVVWQVLQGEPVARFMTVNPITVPSSLDLRSLVENYSRPAPAAYWSSTRAKAGYRASSVRRICSAF
jgi:hypothetical protein